MTRVCAPDYLPVKNTVVSTLLGNAAGGTTRLQRSWQAKGSLSGLNHATDKLSEESVQPE